MRPYLLLLLVCALLSLPFAAAVSSGDVGESVVNIFVSNNQTFLNVTNITVNNVTFLNVTNITNVFNVTNVTNVTEINGSLILNPLDPAIVVSNGVNGSATNISLNYSIVQARINGTCTGNSAFGSVNEDGTVNCNSISTGSGNISGGGIPGYISYWTSSSNLASSYMFQNGSGLFVFSNFYADYLFGDGSNITGIPTFSYIETMNTTIYQHMGALNASILAIVQDNTSWNETYANTLYDSFGRSYPNITNLQTSNTSAFSNIASINANKSGIGDCPASYVVQNLTNGSPQCVFVNTNNASGTMTSVTAGTGLTGGTITTNGTIAINETYLNNTINNISIIQEVVYNTSCVVVVSNCSAVLSTIHFQITNIVVTPVNLSGTYRFEMTEYPNASNVIDTNRIPHNSVWNIQKNYAINGQSQVNVTSANAGSSFNFAITYITNGVQ